MRFTEEMIAEDEKRWHARDVVTELGYCSTYMRDRKDMTNLDIRFYAYIMRRAHEMLKAQEPITGETSDGYHTFNELYHHRAVLFSVIVGNYPDRAWKAKKHHDGTMYDGMFIVGIETPSGQATYHYDVIPYWDMFKCRELESAPEWDGHTPAQAIERIEKLAELKTREPVSVPVPVSIKDSDGGTTHLYFCGSCQALIQPGDNYCHECGKAVK